MITNEQIASAILSSRTVEEAAKKLDTSPSVIYERKRKDKRLNELLQSSNREIVQGTVNQLLQLNSEAIEVLHNSLSSPVERMRITAAVQILKLSESYFTAADLVVKLKELEDQLAEEKAV